MKLKFGIMTQDIRLLGTGLTLKQGMVVKLQEATNLGREGEWFASPLSGEWPDGIEHSPEDSILLTETDGDFVEITAAQAANHGKHLPN